MNVPAICRIQSMLWTSCIGPLVTEVLVVAVIGLQ